MRRFLFVAWLGILLPAEAKACWGPPSFALIHNAVPHSLPQDWIVADVRILSTDLGRLEGDGVTVEVRRMIRGDNPGRTMIVIDAGRSICSEPFENGTEGLVIGVPFGIVNGQLVVGLIEANGMDGYRLPDDLWPGMAGNRVLARIERRRAEFQTRMAPARVSGQESAPPAPGE